MKLAFFGWNTNTGLVGTVVVSACLAGCGSPHRATPIGAAGQMSDRAARDHADDADEVVISLDALPAEVRRALARITTDDRVTKVVREQENGATTYDVEYLNNGAVWAAEFSAAGAVLENEPDTEDAEGDGAHED